jgi:hypothetical protein
LTLTTSGKTFPIAYCYITSGLAASFKFTFDRLRDLAFNDCPEATVIVGDFSKGLGAAADLGLTEIIDEPSVFPQKRDGELPEAAAVIVGESQGDPQQIILQLCKWHAVSAIKELLVAARRYRKEIRDELISIIWPSEGHAPRS